MKFNLCFKMPDVLDQITSQSETELTAALKLARKYIEYGEYVRIEFDTETQTATVSKV